MLPILRVKHGFVAVMINGGYHGIGNSAGPNIVVFVHPARQQISTQKNEGGGGGGGGFNISVSNFAWLSQKPSLNYWKNYQLNYSESLTQLINVLWWYNNRGIDRFHCHAIKK